MVEKSKRKAKENGAKKANLREYLERNIKEWLE